MTEGQFVFVTSIKVLLLLLFNSIVFLFYLQFASKTTVDSLVTLPRFTYRQHKNIH